MNTRNMNPIAYFLLVLFLGPLGIHKFIDGSDGVGILYLFTCGIFGIGWLIDVIKSFILIFTKSSSPAPAFTTAPAPAVKNECPDGERDYNLFDDFANDSDGGDSSSNAYTDYGNQPQGKRCKECGILNDPDASTCSNCGARFNNAKNATVIIWLILFFPVGLYLMWAKTNWNKTVKIVISAVFALFLIVGLISGLTEETSPTGITALTNSYDTEIDLDLKYTFTSSETTYIEVESSDDFSVDDLQFISTDPKIATVEYESTKDNLVYFEITALQKGETAVYVQTKDGTIKSDEIKVVCTGEKPATTEAATEESTTERTTEKTTEHTTENKKVTYIVNGNSKLFHRPSCQYVNKMNESNKIEVKASNIQEMENQGYKPCSKCIGK